MSKVDIKRLDSVTKNDTTATEQINDNFQALQAAIENTVSRDGTVPNYMDADLDLNSYRIINAGAPVEGKDVVTLEYFEEKAGGAIEAAAEAKASASKAASSAQSALVASNNAVGQLAQAEGLLTAAEGQLADTKQYVDAARADISQTVEDSIEYVEQEAVKAATEVVGSVVGQYTDRAETAAKNAEADATRTAESANRASASATSAATSASEAEAIAGEVSVYNFKNKITNCITEIPQDIKLELNNGILTLKAGSKVYVPNGVGKFDEVVISADITSTLTRGDVTPCFVFCSVNGSNIYPYPMQATSSGTTAPTGNGTFYNTTTNEINYYSNGVKGSGRSLPIAIVTAKGDGTASIVSIDQVFNGFGYIGSTVFALPGVKGLIPNGRNTDGSLRNTELTVDRVLTRTITDTGTRDNITVGFSPYRGSFFGFSLSAYYDENTNFNKESEGGSNWPYALIGNASYSATKLTSFTPKLPFRAVDQNDFNKLDEEVVKTSGNQTIAGVKTFTSQIERTGTINSNGAYIDRMTDSNVGSLEHLTYYTGASLINRMMTRNTKSGGKVCYLDVTTTDTGEGTLSFNGNTTTKLVNFTAATAVKVVTPEATDNSSNAATTAWVNSSFKNILIPNTGSSVNIATAISSTNGYTAPSSGFVSVQTNVNGATTTLSVGGVVVAQAQQYSGDSHGGETKQLFALVGKGQVVKTSQTVGFGVFVPFK